MPSEPNQNQSDPLVEVVQNLPDMANRPEPTPTVTSDDGTVVTLGEEARHTADISSANTGMNQKEK